MPKIKQGFEKHFVTGVGLITSRGRKYGYDVMSAEWTMQISYNPPIIAVFINPKDVTHANILETKVFGVNMVADDMPAISHLCGSVSRRDYDKLADKHFKGRLYKAKTINVKMIKDCTINAECRLIFHKKFGSHTMFVGRVLAAKFDKNKEPIAYHGRKYFYVVKQVPRQD